MLKIIIILEILFIVMSSSNLNNIPEQESTDGINLSRSVTYSEAIELLAELTGTPVTEIILNITEIPSAEAIFNEDDLSINEMSEELASVNEVTVTPAQEDITELNVVSETEDTTVVTDLNDTNRTTKPAAEKEIAASTTVPEQSDLSKIENTPLNPMNLFKMYYEEAEKYSKSIVPVFSLASVSKDNRILNRNVILRSYDNDGFIFACERNTRKYQDFMENPNVAATFLWTYKKLDDSIFTYHQIRINGYVSELTKEEIKKLYEEESLSAKIRIKICVSSNVTDWKKLKRLHDEVLINYQNGIDKLEQPMIYVGFRIIPKTIDFFHTVDNFIPDRVLYTKNFKSGRWMHTHVCA